MNVIVKHIFITCFIFLIAHASNAQENSYTSLTFKKSVWTSSSYVGDLADWVYFDEGNARVIEYRAPESSFSISASIRESEDGGNELESLVGATRLGNTFIKLETGGASGQLFNPNKLEPLILPEDKEFEASLNMLAIGKAADKFPGVKYGAAWVHLTQPAQIDLTYYSVLASAGVVGAPKWAESAVDPEFSTHIVGFWFDVDSLSSFMQGQGTFYSNPTISGHFLRGLALDIEMVAGVYFSDPGTDFEPILKEAYGLNYKYVDSTGFAWTVSYKLAYNLVYKPKDDLALGLQVGVEGRALQTLLELTEDESVSTRDEVIGKIGIGDNSSYQWGPYVRLAMEF